MRIEVVSIGDALLQGEILDTNAAYITRNLRELAVDLTARVIVGNDQGLIASALEAGLARADLVICAGGLGVRSDDYTRHAVADISGENVIRDRPGVSNSRALGAADGAYGLLLNLPRGTLICLPGNQRDLTYLFQTEVLPYLQARLPRDGNHGWTAIRTAGIMESNVRQRLAGLNLPTGAQISYTSYAGQTDIRVSYRAETEAALAETLGRLATEIEEKLGDHVYGRDGDRLEEQLWQMLHRNRLSVAVVEVGTDGTMTEMVQTVAEAEKVFTFIPLITPEGLSHYLQVVAPGRAGDLTHWCRQVAQRLRPKMGADLGLVVYKNVTPGGVQLLITLAAATGVSVTQRSFGGHPGNVDHWAGTLGMVQLRRWLLDHCGER